VNRKDLKRLNAIRNDCKLCDGAGFIEKRTEAKLTLSDCVCVQRVSFEIKMLDAHIPKQYRNWTFKELEKSVIKENKESIKTIRSYIKNLPKNINAGIGLWLNAPSGLAKSSMICALLKRAIDQGYTPYFGKAKDFVSLKFQALRNQDEAVETLKFIYDTVDILAVEEIDKVYQSDDKSMPNILFYEFLADAYDANISLLVSSNQPRDKHERTLPPFIGDRLKTLIDVPFTGITRRKDRRRKLR